MVPAVGDGPQGLPRRRRVRRRRGRRRGRRGRRRGCAQKVAARARGRGGGGCAGGGDGAALPRCRRRGGRRRRPLARRSGDRGAPPLARARGGGRGGRRAAAQDVRAGGAGRVSHPRAGAPGGSEKVRGRWPSAMARALLPGGAFTSGSGATSCPLARSDKLLLCCLGSLAAPYLMARRCCSTASCPRSEIASAAGPRRWRSAARARPSG